MPRVLLPTMAQTRYYSTARALGSDLVARVNPVERRYMVVEPETFATAELRSVSGGSPDPANNFISGLLAPGVSGVPWVKQNNPVCAVAGRSGVWFSLPNTGGLGAGADLRFPTTPSYLSGYAPSIELPNPHVGRAVRAQIFMMGLPSPTGSFYAPDLKGGTDGSGEFAYFAGVLPATNNKTMVVQFRNVREQFVTSDSVAAPAMHLLHGNLNFKVGSSPAHSSGYGRMGGTAAAAFSNLGTSMAMVHRGCGNASGTINYSDATSYPASGVRSVTGSGASPYKTPWGNLTTTVAATGSSMSLGGISYGTRYGDSEAYADKTLGDGAAIVIVYPDFL